MECILPSQGDNVIRTKDIDVPYDEYGLAHFLFNAIQQYKTKKIAQINAEGGSFDTYEELLKKSVRVALEMKSCGIKPDDVICLCSENHTDVYVAYLAAILIGAVVSALDPHISKSDMEHLLLQVSPKMVFVTSKCEALMEELLRSGKISSKIVVFGQTDRNIKFDHMLISRDKTSQETFEPHKVEDVFQTALIFFSSGTTGLPKGICLNHYTLMRSILTTGTIMGSMPVTMGFSSAYWISSAILFLSTIFYGNTRILTPKFNTSDPWSHIVQYKVNFLVCATCQAASMLRADIPGDASSLKVMLIIGSKASDNLVGGLHLKLPGTAIIHGYGMTEICGPALGQDNESLQKKAACCGRPTPGICYKIVDPETEQILGPNQPGELRLKTKLQMNGYYKIDSSNAWDSDGWLKTGDIFYYDKEYFFYFVDRLKAVIKYRGIHVQSAVLEDIMLTHPAVDQAVVIGLPHPDDEEHPMAVVVLKDGAPKTSSDELRAYVDEKVDYPKKLRGGVQIVDELPMTPTGKVNLREIKRQMCEELKISIYI